MVGQVIRKKLYIAATQGDATTFQQLLQEDPYLLDVVSFSCSRNLLHIATMHGQVGIVEEITRRNPRLARNLDSHKSTPLHIAAAEGKVEIASKLLAVAPETCWLRDCHGMNPVHIAAMNGHVETLEEIIRHDRSPAREMLDRGQTVLHLCAKHGQLRMLQVLVNNFNELVFLDDDDGETIMHLAVSYKQVEIVRYLVENNIIQRAWRESSRDTSHCEITNITKQTGIGFSNSTLRRSVNVDVVVVAVSLIAGMTFQAAISPPGGVWQDDSSTHKAGTAIMASVDPKQYKQFLSSNTSAFACSIITIILLAVASPLSKDVFVKMAVMFGFFCSLLLFFRSYLDSALALTPDAKSDDFVSGAFGAVAIIIITLRPFSTYIEPKLRMLVIRPCILYVEPMLKWATDKFVNGLHMLLTRVSSFIHN